MLKPVSLLLILSLCCSGYIFLLALPQSRYTIIRSSGYHTFLKSVIAGSLLFILSCLIYLIFELILNFLSITFSASNFLFNKIFPLMFNENSIILSDISLISFLLAGSTYFFYQNLAAKYFYSLTLKYFSQSTGSPEFTDLFFRSARVGLPILFTMSDRKVFIGYISTLKCEDYNDIEIIPMYSGYRDKDSLEVKLITPYLDILEEIEEEAIEDDIFCVSLPLREIVHAHLYDFSYQDDFRQRESDYQKGISYST